MGALRPRAASATGQHFLDLYAGKQPAWSLLDEHPDGSGVCTIVPRTSLAADDPALYDLRKIRGVAALGTHCDFCHKVAGPGEGEVGFAHGHFGLHCPAPVWVSVSARSTMWIEARMSTRPSCATVAIADSCHEGVVFGVHVYTTFSEWRASPAGHRGRAASRAT